MGMPWHHWDFKVHDGRMQIGGCDVGQLARRHGTPLFVIDESKLRRNCRELMTALQTHYPRSACFYSLKTNLEPEILRIVSEEGLGVEVISEMELDIAKRVGIPPERIIFDGIFKPPELLDRLVAEGILLINIDSEREIESLDRAARAHGKRVGVGVRIHTVRGWGSNPFGIEPSRALEVFRRIQETESLDPLGLLMHSSSRATGPRDYVRKARILLRLCGRIRSELGLEVPYIDIGGGYGTPTVRSFGSLEHLLNLLVGIENGPPKADRFVSLPETIEQVSSEVRKVCGAKGLPAPILHLEPGTAIVENAQLLITAVHAVKRIKNERIVVVDASRMNMAQPLRGEYHEVFAATKMGRRGGSTYKIVGRLCSTHDWLYQKKSLPDLQEGDLLAIMDVGAYCSSLQNRFSFPTSAVVSVHEGRSTLIREAGTTTDRE
jgi:diaminopimelate decarboxylase